jgi:disulfide bond formation protein DsbB
MRKFWLFAVLVVVVLALAACGGGAATPAPAKATEAPKPADTTMKGDAVAGKKLYDTACVACHGPDAVGVQGLGKSWVTSTFIKSETDAQILDFVKKGRPASDPANTTGVDMPAKGGNPALTDQDLTNIIAYMRTVNKP